MLLITVFRNYLFTKFKIDESFFGHLAKMNNDPIKRKKILDYTNSVLVRLLTSFIILLMFGNGDYSFNDGMYLHECRDTTLMWYGGNLFF